MNRRILAAGVALLFATVYALGFYALVRNLWPESGMLLASFVFGAPVAACVLGVWVYDPHGRHGGGSHARLGFMVVTVMLIAAGAALREGAVCLAMAAPLFYAVGIAACVAAGGLLNRLGRGRYSLMVALVPLALVAIEQPARYPVAREAVTTSVVIDAPASAVWAHAIEIRDIRDDELGFTFTQDVIGVPKPLDARLEGRGVGAVRHATWRGGVTFDERVVAWREGRHVGWTFHVPEAAQRALLDDHLRVGSDYLDVTGGAYEVTPLADGRTRLTLTTAYRVRSPVNSYAALWGRLFLGDFHRNVLRVVRVRAEARGRAV